MNKYTISCTHNQTIKGLELNAPIEEFWTDPSIISHNKHLFTHLVEYENKYYNRPTAEQMCGWLRQEHNIHVRIDCEGSQNYVVQLQFINSSKDIDVENHNYKGIIGHRGFPSVSEAALAAIDAALEYLEKLKQ